MLIYLILFILPKKNGSETKPRERNTPQVDLFTFQIFNNCEEPSFKLDIASEVNFTGDIFISHSLDFSRETGFGPKPRQSNNSMVGLFTRLVYVCAEANFKTKRRQ